MLSKGQYEALLNKVYRNMDMTTKQLAFIATNPLDKVSSVTLQEDEGILKYKINWENSGLPNVGKVEMD